MPKTSKFAVTEKWQKPAGPRSQKYANKLLALLTRRNEKCIGLHFSKNAKNSQLRSHENMPVNFQVRNHKKPKKCIVQHLCENAKNSQVRGHNKMPKTRRYAVPENVNNSQVHCNGKIPKTHRSAITEICQ